MITWIFLCVARASWTCVCASPWLVRRDRRVAVCAQWPVAVRARRRGVAALTHERGARARGARARRVRVRARAGARVGFFGSCVRLSPPPPASAIHVLYEYLTNGLLTHTRDESTQPVLQLKDAPLKEEKTHACHHMHIHSGRLSEVRFRGYLTLVAESFVASME